MSRVKRSGVEKVKTLQEGAAWAVGPHPQLQFFGGGPAPVRKVGLTPENQGHVAEMPPERLRKCLSKIHEMSYEVH